MTDEEREDLNTFRHDLVKQARWWQWKAETLEKENEQLKAENAALRERLEKAVELPVKLYSKVWDKNRKEFEIIGIELHGTNYYINCANKATGEIASFDGEDIGDEWFTTEELCDLHRRAFGLDKSKIESAEARLAEPKGGDHE